MLSARLTDRENEKEGTLECARLEYWKSRNLRAARVDANFKVGNIMMMLFCLSHWILRRVCAR